MKRHATLLFSRIPVAGQVKTRLMPVLSGADCAALQGAMTADAAEVLAQQDRDLYLYHSDDGPLETLKKLVPGVPLVPQRGAELGERMHRALGAALKTGYENALLLGADLPFLDGGDVVRAGALLEQSDVVLGPSRDGGYWLVGLKKPFPDLFLNQPYGTGGVLEGALEVCRRHGRSVALAPTRRDLDTPEDLAWFQAFQADRWVPDCRTAQFFRTLGDLRRLA